MINNIFSPMEIDAIGEIMNISLGSSATSVSNMLDHRVDITTPRVSVIEPRDLTLGELDPAVGVEIRYVSGLAGSNIMLLKRSDVKSIVDILMGTETPDADFELNELTISAVCELMNQMMGAASTALSDFLGRMVNISTPQSFELSNFEDFKAEHFPPSVGMLVVVRFTLTIEGSLQSEFMNVITVELARELISGFGLEDLSSTEVSPLPEESGGSLSQADVEKLLANAAPPRASTTSSPPPASTTGALSQKEIEDLLGKSRAEASPSTPLSQDEVERLLQREQQAQPFKDPSASAPPQSYQMDAPPGSYPQPYGQPYPPDGASGSYPPPYGQPFPGYYPPPPYYYPAPQQAQQLDPKVINAQPVALSQMDAMEQLAPEQAQNLDLIMTIPLDVSVEIGRTRRKVQDILSLTKGSLVVLDKLAGDQVDLYVNGQCIAKGDVVVIDDNFGIRITAILTPADPRELISY
ncbi:MAG: fliY [Firmicutes bacterium]|nr:fliY [Bacillota bacterium]